MVFFVVVSVRNNRVTAAFFVSTNHLQDKPNQECGEYAGNKGSNQGWGCCCRFGMPLVPNGGRTFLAFRTGLGGSKCGLRRRDPVVA